MAFFKMGNDKKTVMFAESSKKHYNEPVEAVARADPKYLTWVWNKRMVGLDPEFYEIIEGIMKVNGVPFTHRRKK